MTQRRGWRVSGGLVAMAIAGLVVILIVIGQVVASGRAAGESSGGTPALRSMVRGGAYDFWDNPGQRWYSGPTRSGVSGRQPAGAQPSPMATNPPGR